MTRDRNAWRKNFEALSRLEDGWLRHPEQPSSAPDKAGMARLRPIFEMLFLYIPGPRMFPWVTGTLSLEWHDDDGTPETMPSAEVHPASAGLRAELLAGMRGGGVNDFDDLDVDLATPEGRALFITFIQARMAKLLPG